MLWILLHSSFKQQNSIRNVAFLQSFQAFHEWIRMIPQGIVFFELVLLCNNCTCRCNTDDMISPVLSTVLDVNIAVLSTLLDVNIWVFSGL